MRARELAVFTMTALVALAASARADPPDYGKVDTFQPGKKYDCVPTADHKGWDCKETGKAEIPSTPAPAAKPAPPAQPQTPPGPAPAAVAAPPASAAAPHSSALPSYLTASGASGVMQPMPATAAPKPAPKPRARGPMVPAQTPAAPPPEPKTAAAPVPAPAKPAPAAPAPEPAPVSAAPAAASATGDFLALPAASYVVELAHADSKAGLDAARATAKPAHGGVYELHLLQNGNDAWLLLWGPFDDLESARAARAELAAQGATPGWPRRVGPLQAEARHSQP